MGRTYFESCCRLAAGAGGLVAGRGAGCVADLRDGALGPCRWGGRDRRDGVPEEGQTLSGGGATVQRYGGLH